MDNDTLAVNSLTDSLGDYYSVAGTAQAAYVRTANAQGSTSNTDPAAISAWYMGNNAASTSSAPASLLASYDSGSPAALLLGNNLLQGADNLFNNVNSTSDQNNATDVERMDMIYNGTAGTTATDTLSIGVFDRGVGDSFEVAVITGIDSNGNPTSYGGNLVSVTAADFGQNLLTTSDANSTVLDASGSEPTDYLVRYDSATSLATGNVTADTTHNNQNIAGVVLTMDDLGIVSGTKIYGYSIMAGDVGDAGNINNLVNYNNTTFFPTNTNESSSSGDNGGLDPVAVNGVLFEEHPVPEPATYGVLLLGLCLAGALARRIQIQAA